MDMKGDLLHFLGNVISTTFHIKVLKNYSFQVEGSGSPSLSTHRVVDLV